MFVDKVGIKFWILEGVTGIVGNSNFVCINSDGFYATSYKKVKSMAQCEGDLNLCACKQEN